MLVEKVAEILVETAEEVIEPRFRTLVSGQVSEKATGSLVTVADLEAEELITKRLRELLPVPVVGEEAVAEHPDLKAALRTEPEVWVVDPLDGTSNFVAGRPDYAVMAALVRDGETVAGCIWHPSAHCGYLAERGAGAWSDGRRLVREPAPPEVACLSGVAPTRFLEPWLRARVEEHASRFGAVTGGHRCAGLEYTLIAEGEQDFTLFWQTLPWDHAAGSLLVTETGGVAAWIDGTPYRPARDGRGLLVASDPECWERVRHGLLAEGGTGRR